MSAPRQNRSNTDLRPVTMTLGFHKNAEGSVLYSAGGTVLLVTASIEEQVPEFMKGRGEGWVTAEYQMHPRANPVRREKRDGRERPLGGRAREIERLIGRSLRAAIDRRRLGERQIVVDCDVLEADGGTRTAAITAGFVALVLGLETLRRRQILEIPVIRDQVAAISVGHVKDEARLDLDYREDSSARVDLNLVATGSGRVVELQSTAEGEAIERATMDAMVDLAMSGVQRLCALQAEALREHGLVLDRHLVKGCAGSGTG